MSDEIEEEKIVEPKRIREVEKARFKLSMSIQ